MSKIKTISIDIETFSDVDLQKCGVYKYVQSPVFEVLLFGYSVNGAAVQVAKGGQSRHVACDPCAAARQVFIDHSFSPLFKNHHRVFDFLHRKENRLTGAFAYDITI